MPSLKKNLLYNILYQVLIVFIPLILSPYISRVLGANLLGVYSYTFSVANYFVLFASLGISIYGNRSIARVRNDKTLLSKTFISIYAFQLFTSTTMILVYLTYLTVYSGSNFEIAFIQLLLVISNMFDITWFFFGIEESKVTVTRNTIIKVLTLLLVLLFVKSENDLPVYTLIMAGGTFLGQISIWPFLRKRVFFLKPTLQEVVLHIKPIMILFIPILAYGIFAMMGRIMLGFMTNMKEVGYFENADKIISIPRSLIRAVGVVMLARISNLIAENKVDESEQYLSKTILYVGIVSSAMAFGLAAVGPVFAPVFWGEEFFESGKLIVYLAPVVVFSAWGSILRNQYMIPNQMDKEYTVSLIIAVVVNIGLNMVFIGRFGAIGAAISAVVAECILMIYQFIVVNRKIPIMSYYINGYVFYLIGFMMFGFIRVIQGYLPINTVSLLIQIVAGGIFYTVVSLFYIMLSNNKNIIEIKLLLKSKVKVTSRR